MMKCTLRTASTKMCASSLTSCSQLCKICLPVIWLGVRSVATPTNSTQAQTTFDSDASFEQMKENRSTETLQKTLCEEEGTKVKKTSNTDNANMSNNEQFAKLNDESPTRKSVIHKKPVNNIVMTACGRFLNWEIVTETFNAMLDKRWAKTIMLEAQKDNDFVESVRRHGTVISVFKEIQSYNYDDEGVRDEILKRVQDNEKLAINLCAMQDAYVRIRQERRDDEIARIAEGKSVSVAKSLREDASQPFGYK